MALRELPPVEPWDVFSAIVSLLQNILQATPEELAEIMAQRGQTMPDILPQEVPMEDLPDLMDEKDRKDTEDSICCCAVVSLLV
eukprot:4037463-Lingulodinium_polyedra.AAC.1